MPFLKPSTTPHLETDRPSLRERAAGLRAGLARIAGRPAPQEAPRDVPQEDQQEAPVPVALSPDLVDWHSPPPGFMAYPAIEPQGFLNIPDGIRLELERLHGIAAAEFERRSRAASGATGESDAAGQIERRRRRLHLDVLEAALEEQGPLADAALIALEAEFLATDAALAAACQAACEARDAYAEPEMPKELRVWRNDWFMNGIPRTPMDPLPDGRGLPRPYGEREVGIMRANPCTRVGFGTEGEPLPGGGRLQPDRHAQARADAIVAAWDAWQAEITAAREALNIPVLVTAMKAAREVRNVVLQRVRETPARGLPGLAIKARIAANLASEHDLGGAGLELFEPDDGDAFLYSLAGDVLGLTGGMPASHGMED